MSEQILCTPRHGLPAEWIGECTATPVAINALVDRVNRAGASWQERAAAEQDPAWKQLIPYVVVQHETNDGIGCYRRSGSEKRLHDLWSVGIGGHINPRDADGDDSIEIRRTITAGLRRELAEEMGVGPTEGEIEFLGVINEERTPVGAVHLGLVFLLRVDRGHGVHPGEELADFFWADRAALDRLRMEHWSRLALELVASRDGAIKNDKT